MVRVYQTGTGAWLRDLEKADEPLVTIEFDRSNSKLLWGCTNTGTVIVWKWRSGVKEKRFQLQFKNVHTMVNSFNVIPNDDMDSEGETQRALVSYLDKGTREYLIETFDLESGKSGDAFDISL